MTGIIFIIISVLEIALGVFCIVTGSEQKKIQNIVHISIFGLFAFLCLLSVLKWGIRWYGLGILLTIWLIRAVASIICGSGTKKEFKKGHIVAGMALKILLICIVLLPAFIFPQYTLPLTTGQYTTSNVSYVWTDSSREEYFTRQDRDYRFVNIEFWYPSDYDGQDGTCPLIIFSHGAYGMKAAYQSIYEELASNGYIVCAIDHPYHALMTTDAYGKAVIADSGFLDDMNRINSADCTASEEEEIINRILTVRTEDICFVLDTIDEMISEPDGQAKIWKLIDIQQIGLMGHSLGGGAAAQAAKERKDICCVINIDGDFFGEEEFFEDKAYYSDKTYNVPLLCFWSDWIHDGIKIIGGFPFLERASDAYQVHIKGTDHFSYTDLPYISPILYKAILKMNGLDVGTVDQEYCSEKMNHIILQFCNSYLKGADVFEIDSEY